MIKTNSNKEKFYCTYARTIWVPEKVLNEQFVKLSDTKQPKKSSFEPS